MHIATSQDKINSWVQTFCFPCQLKNLKLVKQWMQGKVCSVTLRLVINIFTCCMLSEIFTFLLSCFYTSEGVTYSQAWSLWWYALEQAIEYVYDCYYRNLRTKILEFFFEFMFIGVHVFFVLSRWPDISFKKHDMRKSCTLLILDGIITQSVNIVSAVICFYLYSSFLFFLQMLGKFMLIVDSLRGELHDAFPPFSCCIFLHIQVHGLSSSGC